jgi:hypothetical protein
MMLRLTSLIRLLHLGPAFKLVVHVNSIVARDPDEGLFYLGYASRTQRSTMTGRRARKCLLMAPS